MKADIDEDGKLWLYPENKTDEAALKRFSRVDSWLSGTFTYTHGSTDARFRPTSWVLTIEQAPREQSVAIQTAWVNKVEAEQSGGDA